MLVLNMMEGNSKKRLTKEEADAFRIRWELVNAAEIEELLPIVKHPPIR